LATKKKDVSFVMARATRTFLTKNSLCVFFSPLKR